MIIRRETLETLRKRESIKSKGNTYAFIVFFSLLALAI